MINWRQAVISPDSTIEETIKVLDQGALRTVFVLENDSKLLGIVTDGDIRRGLLQHIPLGENVSKVMNSFPFVAHIDDSRERILAMMRNRGHLTVPLVDDDMRMVGIETLQSILNKPRYENTVVLMAGGLGMRLRPLTNNCPKPLLEVGGKPLLEIILERFIEDGFSNFLISINYMGGMIKDYFGDGRKWGVRINYIEENERLGTAGPLSMIDTIDKPFIVMNGDLLTSLNAGHLLDFHLDAGAVATMCVRRYEHRVPYGVVNFDDQRLLSIEEKPLQKMFVNAGVYVFDPSILQKIPQKKYHDMNELFDTLMQENKPVSVFPIREYWLDIGRLEDFEAAHEAYYEFFS